MQDLFEMGLTASWGARCWGSVRTDYMTHKNQGNIPNMTITYNHIKNTIHAVLYSLAVKEPLNCIAIIKTPGYLVYITHSGNLKETPQQQADIRVI